ncbi:MAG: hypothetical protein LUD74_06635 [Tannerellaceae bacterium]|nr:hypothetical protein [Tannerellaceae bacterium]
MDRKLVYLFLISFLFAQCHLSKNKVQLITEVSYAQPDKQKEWEIDPESEARNRETALEHEKAWEEARKYRETITDSVFLQTKRPMSDDAIGPYNYHTGFKEDRAYNQVVYIAALERTKKYLSVSEGKLILNLQSGQDINIAEDLFQYIVNLYDEWNQWIAEGLFKIIQTADGYYDIAPTRNAK